MCNPRRIMVQARRRISEAFRAEITRAATARGSLSSEARLEQQIDDLLPRQARLAFESAMRDSPDWTWADGEYRQTVPGGVTTYRPDTGELTIVITLSQAIEAVGEATLVSTGEVSAELSAEGRGTYYTDGWSGHTREAAERQAQAAAEASLDEQAGRRLATLKEEAQEKARYDLNARTEEAEREALRTAEQRLTAQADELRPDLDTEAARQLEAVQAATLQGIMQTVAAGYSRALQEYAALHGENLQVTERDGVIEIQFEMER